MKRILTVALAILLAISMLVATASAASGDTVVYITKTGECYHTGTCRYLSKSKIQTTLSEAVKAGYRPCSVCKPPKLSATPSIASSNDSDIFKLAGGAALLGGGYALAKRKKRP